MITRDQFVELAKQNRIKIRIPMRPLERYLFICAKSSSSKAKKVWCNVEPKGISSKDCYYKLYLISEDEDTYGRDEYYRTNIVSLMNEGKIECKIIA